MGKDISCTTNALRSLQNFSFLDKPMRIAYCKTKSDVIALEDGTFRPRAADGTKQQEEAKPKAKGKPQPKKQAADGDKDAKLQGAVPKSAAPNPAAGDSAGDKGDKEGQPSNVLF